MIFAYNAIDETAMTWGQLWWAHNGNYILYGIAVITAVAVFFVLKRKE